MLSGSSQIAFRKDRCQRLRTVLESALIPVMFDVPSRDDIREIMINREVILKQAQPVYSLKKDKKIA